MKSDQIITSKILHQLFCCLSIQYIILSLNTLIPLIDISSKYIFCLEWTLHFSNNHYVVLQKDCLLFVTILVHKRTNATNTCNTTNLKLVHLASKKNSRFDENVNKIINNVSNNGIKKVFVANFFNMNFESTDFEINSILASACKQ